MANSKMKSDQSKQTIRETIMRCSNQVYIPNDTKDYTGVEVGVNVLELEQALLSLFDAEMEKRKQERIVQNKSFCGCPMCEHHSAPYQANTDNQSSKENT